jgi:hypothetical protein
LVLDLRTTPYRVMIRALFQDPSNEPSDGPSNEPSNDPSNEPSDGMVRAMNQVMV